jgi:hypothetical protein
MCHLESCGVLTAVAMTVAIFRDIAPCSTYKPKFLRYVGSHMDYRALYPLTWQCLYHTFQKHSTYRNSSSNNEKIQHKPEGHGFNSRWGHCFSSIHLILPVALRREVYLASNRNEYKKQRMFLGSEETAGAKVWQSCRHLLADFLDNVGSLTSHNFIGLHGLLRDSFTF